MLALGPGEFNRQATWLPLKGSIMSLILFMRKPGTYKDIFICERLRVGCHRKSLDISSRRLQRV